MWPECLTENWKLPFPMSLRDSLSLNLIPGPGLRSHSSGCCREIETSKTVGSLKGRADGNQTEGATFSVTGSSLAPAFP